MRPLASAIYSLALLVLSAPFSTAQTDKKDPAGIEFFEKKIRPVLAEHCYQCHAAKSPKLKANLLLDTKAGTLKGGDSGPALVAGHPEKSLIVSALKQTGDLRMPPKGKLPDEVVADFARWIAMGAPDPREGDALKVAAKDLDWTQARQFWAFQSPTKHSLPAVKNIAWPKKDVDFFILSEMDKRQLKPVRPATKLELIRRASFDLVGLPPTPDEIDAFLKDTAPDAFAKVVDRLLASPHYGERWGRYWLDVARFADDRALAKAEPYPHAHRYRDWVIQALNQDMPYDRFLRLQLAGDMLTEPANDFFTRLAGLGFQGLGAEYHKGNFAAQVMADELDDRVDTLTRGLLGLTVACARCHDHKYDPIPTLDYYSLASAYQGSTLSPIPIAPLAEVEKFNAWDKEAKQLQAKLAKSTQAKADRKVLDALKADIENHKKAAPPAPALIHGVRGGGQALRVNIRGNVERLGDPAPPGFLRILKSAAPPAAKPQFSRLDLANAIATADNPLTARVFVNRVWANHFGRGIVGTPSNFGKLGDRPTHPELLDTLAVRFIEAGWSSKWLHREIMLSATYQLSSLNDSANAAKDVENRYLWRMAPRRLDFEAWRDAILMVSGRLDATLGGPSFELADAKAGNQRRTIYAKVSRVTPNSMLTMFDFPDANVSSARRSVTTIPQQQLFVLNSEFMIDSAKMFAARLEKAAKNDEERIDLAFRLAYGRLPEAAEKRIALAFLRSTVTGGAPPGGQDRLSSWEQYAQAVLATNEFAWID